MSYGFPDVRLRRLRRSIGMRRMVGCGLPAAQRLLWPVFVTDGSGVRSGIESMPGQYRYSVDRLCSAWEPLASAGVGGMLLFGVPEGDAGKSPTGDVAWRDDGLVQEAVRTLRSEFPEAVIFTDVCLCAYTSHGHCGVATADGEVDNDATLPLLARMAVSHAAAGATGVAPSAMMDGQVRAIREGLDGEGLTETVLMSYSTKFASALYGPFRDAAESAPSSGDRRGYQAPADDLRQALRESQVDEEEGADILMVKPGLFYLDVLTRLRDRTDLPLAVYNVSGEYAMVHAAAERGWGDLSALARESLVALDRAGADIIITYWASLYHRGFRLQA